MGESPNGAAVIEKAPAKEKNVLEGADVLVVDDIPSVLEMTEKVFKRNGSSVRTAVDGVEALAQVAIKVPDLIFTDHDMPRIDGTELIERLRSDPLTRDVPIILASGSIASRQTQPDPNRIGPDAIFSKPFSIFSILERAKELLSARTQYPDLVSGNPPTV